MPIRTAAVTASNTSHIRRPGRRANSGIASAAAPSHSPSSASAARSAPPQWRISPGVE